MELQKKKNGGNEKINGAISDLDVEEASDKIEARITLSNGRKLRAILSSGSMTEAECALDFFTKYVRIEISDLEGRKAWTNPMLLE